MKFILSFVLITVTSGFPFNNDNHYVQHQSTVDTARNQMSQRLSEMESRAGSQRLQSGYGTNSFCGTCINDYSNSQSSRSSQSSSSHSSGSSSNLVEGSDYVGVGYVGHASDQNNLQSRLSPYGSYGRGSSSNRHYSSNSAYDEEDLQQRQVPADLNQIQSSAYRSAPNNQEDVQRNIGYQDLNYNNDNAHESYSQRSQQEESSESQRTISQPRIYYVPSPVSSSSSQSASESSNQQRISMSVRPGTATVIRVPLSVVQTPSVSERSQFHGSSYQASGAESRPTTYSTYYVPTNSYTSRYGSSGNQHDSTRTSVQQPEKYTASNSYNSQSRSQNEESESYQSRVSPSTITDGGASRYSTSSGTSSNNQYQTRVVQPFPVQSIESASLTSQRTADEQQQRRYTPSRPNYVQRTYSNNEESKSESSQSENSNVYAPSISSHSLQQQQQQQQSEYGSRAGNVYSPYSPTYGTSTRFGTGISYSNSDNLYDYMNESERLARLQQQQIASSQSSSSQSSAAEANRRTMEMAQRLDSSAANFVGSSNVANRNSEFDTENVGTSGTGGFQRVKSWQKQSKWESGSQYGTDGKPKSFSMLSTAESEKHNINGNEAGYKAATTTLENDGKVSTYSIHSP